MLRFLRVKHLAVLDTVEVEFDTGLNVLTGETGAGKSILVEAVGLLLGGRASGELVRTGEESAVVEAIFESAGEELLVRREISAQGRSRAFINGELATAGALKDLSGRLIELHGQHEHQTLLDPTTHLSVLDTYGGLSASTAATADAFARMQAAREELARVKAAAHDRESRVELARFQLGELERAALKSTEPGEDAELAALRQVLSSAERVERLCSESYASLYERDDAILAALGNVWRRVAELASLDPRFQPYLDARDGIKSQLEDLATFLRRYADGIEASPERLQQVEDRLALLERLKRKHGPTLADVIAKRDALSRELADLERGDERIAELAGALDVARATFLSKAGALSKERKRVAAGFGQALEQLLKNDIAIVLMDVSMPELDGFELARMIRQHPRFQQTAIIFISAVHLTDLDRLKGYQRGAVDYISVPIIPELLRAKVSVFAELHRRAQQLQALNHELRRLSDASRRHLALSLTGGIGGSRAAADPAPRWMRRRSSRGGCLPWPRCVR
jgi:DNA repair protein RecN (Recombination protein N)